MNEKRYAILIGNNEFPNSDLLQELRCPLNDLDGLNKVLASEDLGNFHEVILLKNKPHYTIKQELHHILKKTTKNDLVLIYYSGHGKSTLKGKLHLATNDTDVNLLESTSLAFSDITDFVQGIPFSKKCIIILDCCFSGIAGTELMRSGMDDQLQMASYGRGIYLMTACLPTGLAKEADQYGIFTKHLIEGIASGEADADGDGRIGVEELFKYVRDRVVDDGFQEPMKWGIGISNEIFLAKSNKKAERIRSIRKKLMDCEDMMPEHILKRAFKIIDKKPEELCEKDSFYNDLLDSWHNNQIGIKELMDSWHIIDSRLLSDSTKFENEIRREAAKINYQIFITICEKIKKKLSIIGKSRAYFIPLLICLIIICVIPYNIINNYKSTDNSNQDPTYWQGNGITLFNQGEFETAVQAFDKAIELNESYAAAWVNRGVALNKLSKYSDALIAYDKAINIDSNDSIAWYNKGNTLYNINRFNESVQAYNSAINIDPRNAISWYGVGNSFYMMGRYQDAIEAYNRAESLGLNSTDHKLCSDAKDSAMKMIGYII